MKKTLSLRNSGSAGSNGKVLVTVITIMIIAILMQVGECKQTILLPSLEKKNDKILFRILQETNSMLKSTKKVNNKDFECFSIVKNNLVPNQLATYMINDYSINFFNSIIMRQYYRKYTNGELDSQQQAQVNELNLLYHKLDSILDILKGQCLYFRTITFLTEYCHKVHVRQFDDDLTKVYNQKPLYEDFNLGMFNQDRRAAYERQKVVPQYAPKKADLAQQFSILQVQSRYNFAMVELTRSQDGKVVHSNLPLVEGNRYLDNSPTLIEMICNNEFSTDTSKDVGFIVGPFEVVYIKKQGQCEQYQRFRFIDTETPYEYRQPLRVYKNFLYGQVEQQCTKHWNWKKQGEEYRDAEIKDGSRLLIEFYDNNTKKHHHQFVEVKKVYHAELMEIDRNIGVSVPVIDSQIPTISRITNCQLLFDHQLSETNTIQNTYIRKGIMRINSSIVAEGQINHLGCVCSKVSPKLAIDMEVTVSKKLWGNDYEVYLKSNRFIRNYSDVKHELFSSCDRINCSKFVDKQTQSNHYQVGFTKIVKLTHKNDIYNITEESKDHVFIFRIHREGVVRLTTVDSKGTVQTYILTEGQLLRIKEYENGTKEVEKQNYYYENITLSSAEGKTKYLYIYVSKLPNGTHIGGIWNIKDPLHFPRMRLVDQKIVSFELRSGYAYIRELNPKKMKDPKSLAIVNYVDLLSKHYLWQEPSQNQQNSEVKSEEKQSKQFFLQESYSINYTYTHGDMCGAPFNRPRTTTVTLRCGRSWYEISEVHEVAPCSYWIQVDTLLLCKSNIRTLIQSDLEIPVKQPSDSMIFSGMVCIDEVDKEETPPIRYIGGNRK